MPGSIEVFRSWEEQPSAVQSILSLCAGLPIALAVTSRVVALRVALGSSFGHACSSYLANIIRLKRLGLSDLYARIRLGLESVEKDLARNKLLICPSLKHSMGDMYTSLCVLKKQHSIPVWVLSRMWEMEEESALKVAQLFSSMSLVTVSNRTTLDDFTMYEVTMHDLHLEYCCQEAGRDGQSEFWSALFRGVFTRNVSDRYCVYVDFLLERPRVRSLKCVDPEYSSCHCFTTAVGWEYIIVIFILVVKFLDKVKPILHSFYWLPLVVITLSL